MAYSACYTSSLISGSGGGSTGSTGPTPNIRAVLQAGNDALGLSLGGLNALGCVDVNASGGITCDLVDATNAVACGTLLSSGLVQCTSLDSTGIITCSSVDASGQVACGSVDSTGAVVCSRVDSTGEVACGSVDSAGGVACASVSATGAVGCASANVSGGVGCSSLVVSGRTYPLVGGTPSVPALGSIFVATLPQSLAGLPSGTPYSTQYAISTGYYAGKIEADFVITPLGADPSTATALVEVFYGSLGGTNIGYSKTLIGRARATDPAVVYTVSVPFFVNIPTASANIHIRFTAFFEGGGTWNTTNESDIDMFRIF